MLVKYLFFKILNKEIMSKKNSGGGEYFDLEEYYKTTVMPFGKYKGKLIKDTDPAYLVWLRSSNIYKRFSKSMKWAILRSLREAGTGILYFGEFQGVLITDIPLYYLKWFKKKGANFKGLPLETRRMINDSIEKGEKYEEMNFQLETKDYQLN